MAAAVTRLPALLTEGELLAARRRRLLRRRAPEPASRSADSAPAQSADSAPAQSAASAPAHATPPGSYKRLKLIGEGAFGAVTKARDLRTGDVVAIKSVRDGAALLREAALLAACLGNPAVVAFREVARGRAADDGHGHRLVMDYGGPSLHELIGARRRRGLPFSESEARRAMAQLLAGAGTLHERGFIHCDLKPGNVLVGEHDRRLRICDLGLTMSVAAPPLDPQLVGTPGYMAPEVLLCEKDCGAAIDVWALWCIMAELVAGQQLFPGDDLCQQLVSIVELLGIPDEVSLMPLGIAAATPSKLREKVSEKQLSPAGFDVLRGLLEYDPKNRLTAAAALQMPWFQPRTTDQCECVTCHRRT